jgi:hypothetical protein
MRKHGLKALVLTVMAALGLMAFSASSALAAELNVIMEPNAATNGNAGFFLIGGVNKPAGAATETIAASGTNGRLAIPAKSAEVDCAAASLTGSPTVDNEYKDWSLATPALKAGGHGLGSATFTGCKVFATNAKAEKGAELAPCSAVVKSEGQAVGTVVAKGLLRVVQHPEAEAKAFIVLEPEVTSVATSNANIALTSKFTKLVFGGTCSLPETADIHGGIVARAPTTDVNKPSLSVKSWEVPGASAVLSAEQKLLGAALTFGANPAFIEANNVIAELTGANKAASWGAM